MAIQYRRGPWSEVRVVGLGYSDSEGPPWFDEVLRAGDKDALERLYDAYNFTKQDRPWLYCSFDGEEFPGRTWLPAICPECSLIFSIFWLLQTRPREYCSASCQRIAEGKRQGSGRPASKRRRGGKG